MVSIAWPDPASTCGNRTIECGALEARLVLLFFGCFCRQFGQCSFHLLELRCLNDGSGLPGQKSDFAFGFNHSIEKRWMVMKPCSAFDEAFGRRHLVEESDES